MKRILEIDGQTVEYELTLKQVKNMNLRICPDGRILVSIPYYVSPEKADAFVRGQKDIIFRTLDRRQDLSCARDFYMGDGGILPIFGRERRLKIREGKTRGGVLYEDRLELTVSDPDSEEQIQKALREKLGQLAERCMPVVCAEVEKRRMSYEIPPYQLRYRCMVGKWGCCYPSRLEISFNKFLVCAPPECMEYVATHEMAHFLVCNHSPEFHRLMDELMPDWRERKKRLEPFGYLLRSL